MRNILVAIALLVAASACAEETHLKVSGPDGLSGTATLVNKIQADGTKYVRLSMKLTYEGGQTSEILQESSYNAEGEPVRMLQTAKARGRKSSIVVTFSDEGAQVVADRGDGPKTNLVQRPNGAIANPTEYWFSKTKPAKGQTAEFFTFRVSEQAWTKSKARYEGVREIVVAGKKVSAHLVQIGEVKSYLDEKGDPYRVELGQLTLERTAD